MATQSRLRLKLRHASRFADSAAFAVLPSMRRIGLWRALARATFSNIVRQCSPLYQRHQVICLSCAKSPGFSTTVPSLRHKNPAKSRAPKTRFHEAFHRDLGCPVPQRKNISLSVFPKSVVPYPVSRSQEGRTRRHERWARDAMDASGVERTSDAAGGRRSRVVLTPRRWCQVLEKQSFFGAMVAKEPGHQGEPEISCKPSRRECRDVLAYLW
jgi:hypothetical protein